MNRSQLIDNLLAHTYYSLRSSDRFLQGRGTKSFFESFWDTLNSAFSLGLKGYHPPNSTVESFYRGTLDVKEFCIQARETVIDKNLDKIDANLDPLLTISWDIYSSVSSRRSACEKIPKLCRRQLWGIFNKLVCDSSGLAMIDDIADVIMKMYSANGQQENENNIMEWFCGQQKIDFWSFFMALAESHSELLAPHVLQVVYDNIFFEILKEGKMKKKGHKVANWKERWFVLSTTQLCYYESRDNRSLKGSVTINRNAKVDKLNPTKDHPYLFRITDGKSNIPYDLSAHDPQIMCDWLETLQVTVAAHSEEGHCTVNKLRKAHSRLFPHKAHDSSKPLPTYKPGGPSEYNEGVYRVVAPSKKNTELSKSPSTESYPPQPFTPIRKDQPTMNGTPPAASPRSISPPSFDTTYASVKSVAGPKIKPYSDRSANSVILLNPPSPPPPITDEDESWANHIYVNVKSPKDTVPNLEFYNSDIGSMSPSPPPLTITQQYSGGNKPNDGYINVQHVNVEGHDYALVDKAQVKSEGPNAISPIPAIQDEHVYVNIPKNQPPEERAVSPSQKPMRKQESLPTPTPPLPVPVPKQRTLKTTKSVPLTPKPNPVVQNDRLDYTTLDFDDHTDPPPQVNQYKSQPKPRNTVIPKQKFDYAEVVLEETNTKDVNKALQLKANRPPPAPPTRYNPKRTEPPPPTPPDRMESHSKVPTSPAQQNNVFQYPAVPTSPSNGFDDSPPPPPPPRKVSAPARTQNDSLPPLPPPRAN